MRTGLLLSLFVLLAAVSVRAQEPETFVPGPEPESSPGIDPDAAARPDAHYYRPQRSRRETARTSSRRTEMRANERVRRMEAMKWYGLSNMRPVVTPTPWFGTYSPMWVSGGYDPSRWQNGDPVSDFTIRTVRPQYIFRY